MVEVDLKMTDAGDAYMCNNMGIKQASKQMSQWLRHRGTQSEDIMNGQCV